MIRNDKPLPGCTQARGHARRCLLRRVVHGGSWMDTPDRCRAALREAHAPSDSHFFLGLRVARVPVGKEISRDVPYAMFHDGKAGATEGDIGSIIIVVATDAPLLPDQLKRLARRATMGLARTGSTSGNGSGDIFIAFSTANPRAWNESPSPHTIQTVSNERMSPLFNATVEVTEEAIVNALVAGNTMIGIDGHKVIGLPHDELQKAMKKYAR